MTGVMCAFAGIGSGVLDTQTVTAGFSAGKVVDVYGYEDTGPVGSISDGTFNPKGGAVIRALYWIDPGDELYFVLTGAQTNDGWTEMQIGAQTFTRASASFTASPDGTWLWSSVTSNPFPVAGNTYVATFR